MKRVFLFLVLFLGFNSFCFSQDSIPVSKDVGEEKNLQFQEFFFKALSEKAIRNYQKAILYLEKCNEILPGNTTVFFEFSKNYYLLGRNQEAKLYVNKALEKDSKNYWMLLHLIEILKKEKNFKRAIELQKQLVKEKPNKQETLVYLYLQDEDYDNALRLMLKMESEVGLSDNLKEIKERLLKVNDNKNISIKKKLTTLQDYIVDFENNNSLEVLFKLLNLAEKENSNVFYQYTEKGLSLFPVQPLLYVYRAKALNQKNQYQKAIQVLRTGLDFVIDNPSVLNEFYRELANSYKLLGNTNKYKEFIEKIKYNDK